MWLRNVLVKIQNIYIRESEINFQHYAYGEEV